MTFLSTAGPEPFRHLWSVPTKCQHLSSQLLLFLASVRRSAETSKLPNIKIRGLFASFRAVTSLPECAFEGGTSGHAMGLDVNSCCRLCLASASSPNATHIDLAQQQEVAEMVQELFGLKINSSGRGSKLLCLVCYKKTTDLKKHLTGFNTKARLVSLNQTILQAQVSAFPEPESDDEVPPQPEGYNAPNSAKQQLFLLVEDCMRSPLFQDRLTDRYDLLYLRVSGPVYQTSTKDFVEMWFPEELRCDRCFTPFESREELKLHLEGTCKYKCIFCRRTYCGAESFGNHVCPKRDKTAKENRKRLNSYAMKTIGKRSRLDVDQAADEGKENGKEVAPSGAEKNDLQLVPVVPRSEGEANLDVELTSLLERWYGGQNEELEELTNLDLEAIEPAATIPNETSPPKPAISVKPISQLIGSPSQPSLLKPVAAIDSRPYNDVIEIEDEADLSRAVVPATAAGQQQQSGGKPEQQQSLSESDILNIVKHFRGIDENESYLIKAKINGASKLICISKRKGQANGGSSGSGSSGINSKPAQATVPLPVRRPVVSSSPPPLVSTVTNTPVNRIPPLAKKPTIKYVPRRGTSYMKHTTGSINGPKMPASIPPAVAAPVPKVATPPQAAPMPQLKIAHVESLVSPTAIAQQQQPRVLNGPMLNPGMQQYNRSTANAANTVKTSNAISPGNSGIAPKQAPRRIIVGSNTIKMLHTPRTIVPKPPQPMVRSPPKPVVTTTSTQQRIVVQRKQIKTVVQSTVRRTSSGGTVAQGVAQSGGGVAGNSMLRTQLLQPQQPPRIYPGPGGAGGSNASVPTSADQLLSSLNSSNRQFKFNNTTFKRLE
ncbi:uncharacterized protein LOC120415377 isoform X3 [Culex pipiens pallens]|uniref:uncharacterized protein LOC120415377 isoform X3 n=1 Tax=Culex pipiens pallens TaxID=42434 RepID=UPI001953E289|nr:uncharacterized protein LOC120415377 isoform X3 [Culex pipiens pallens]